MGGFLVLLGLATILVVLIGSISGLIASSKLEKLRKDNKRTRNQLEWLKSDIKRLTRSLNDIESRPAKLPEKPPEPAPPMKPARPEPEPVSPADAIRELKKKKPAPAGPWRMPEKTGKDIEYRGKLEKISDANKAPEEAEEMQDSKPLKKPETVEPEKTEPEIEKPEPVAEKTKDDKSRPPESEKPLVEKKPKAEEKEALEEVDEKIEERPERIAAPQKVVKEAPALPAKAKVAAAVSAQEWWRKLEEAAGKRWITWVGALVLIVAAGFFVKYAFDHRWLGPRGRIILGTILGLSAGGMGIYFLARKMRALGQGLVGAGMGILYVSLWAACNYYDVLSNPVSFGLMIAVTAVGLTLAVVHNALPICFISILGGFLTPLLVGTGVDARDILFSYLLLLDLGVLGVAFFKRWRALDVLAFAGTWAYFISWYLAFHNEANPAPTVLWLSTFFIVFLIQPFVYHMRLRTPIVGERFFLAVTNAAGMFAWSFIILHPEYKTVLAQITFAMAGAYVVLGAITRRYISEDRKAVFSFIALSCMFLTMGFPILFDFNIVTIAWAVEAPVLLYLAFKYRYFPVRIGSAIPLALAAVRIFTIDWPMHEGAFTWFFNADFGSALMVVLSGVAYATIHRIQWERACKTDRIAKIISAVAFAFLALVVLHIETWTWMGFAGKAHLERWTTSLVWIAGGAVFLLGGLLLRTAYLRLSGFVALGVAAVLVIWDFFAGIPRAYETSPLFLNGRFIASIAGAVVVFAYAFVYRRSKEICSADERKTSNLLYGIGIILPVLAASFGSWQWFTLHGHDYIARIFLPFIWVAGAGAYLGAGLKLRSLNTRLAGIVVLSVACILSAITFGKSVPEGYAMFFNLRFLCGFIVPLMVYAYAVLIRRLRKICSAAENDAGIVFHGIGVFLLTLLVSAETALWFDANGLNYHAACFLPLIWSAGAAGYLATGIKLRNIHLRTAGICVLCVTAVLAIIAYAHSAPGPYSIFFNMRFILSLALPFMVYMYAWLMRKLKKICSESEQVAGIAFHGIGILVIAGILTAETQIWLVSHHLGYYARCVLPVIWVAASAAYLVTGIKLRSAPLRGAGVVVILIASALTVFGYAGGAPGDYRLFVNLRFITALLVPLIIFIYFVSQRSLKTVFNLTEQAASIVFFGAGILTIILLLNAETCQWLFARRYYYLIRCIMPFIWAAGTAAYFISGIALKSPRLRAAGLFVLSIAGALAVVGYANAEPEGYRILLNLRFLTAAFVPLLAFTYGYSRLRFPDRFTEDERKSPPFLYGTGIIISVILVTTETAKWLFLNDYHYASRCIMPLIWIAGAAAYLAAGIRLKSPALRSAGTGLIAVGGILAMIGYLFWPAETYLLYLNGRFTAALLVILMLFANAFLLRLFGRISLDAEKKGAKTFYGVAISALLVLLSVEAYLYFTATIENGKMAFQAAQASLSVTWSVYAIVLLAVGFGVKVQIYRLCALALFGVTALKLVIIDMAKVKDIYRIISFFVLGILMIGASYLYHKVEKWFKETYGGKPATH
ncbi:MAG: DUF2339 domain-containing protein [Planctomycetota bacterium]